MILLWYGDRKNIMIEKPILFGTKYIMKPGMTYYDICVGMRLDESEIPAGILALELLNGPEQPLTEMNAHDKSSDRNS
jgi:hypothetical protein